MDPIKTTGLVIRVAAYREAHQMLTVLTQTHGKIAVSAPGVRSFKNKNHAVASPYRYGEFVLKVTRDGRYSLMEFTPLAFFDNINKSLHTMQTGMFFFRALRKSCTGGRAHAGASATHPQCPAFSCQNRP